MPNRALLDASRRARHRRAGRGLPAFAAFGVGSTLDWPRTITEPQCVFVGADVHFGAYAWFALLTRRAVQVTQPDEIVAKQDFTPRLEIGDRTRFGRDVTIACLGEVIIGPDVLGGDRVLIADTYHDYHDPDRAITIQPMLVPRAVEIGAGAFIGTGAIVSPGVRIGAGAVVSPGAVVTRDVAPGATVLGAPARVVRSA